MSANYVSDADWQRWDTERIERAKADVERTAWQNPPPTREHLLDAIAELEERLAVKSVLLESALELLSVRAVQHARTLELVRVVACCDEILAAPRDLRVAA